MKAAQRDLFEQHEEEATSRSGRFCVQVIMPAVKTYARTGHQSVRYRKV